MTAVIIEDEKNAQEALINLLGLIDSKIKILGTAENVLEAIELINKTKPNILFLDIHLKHGTGFDVLKELNDFKGKLIFTTAFEKYAMKAIKHSAFDYLLKPIIPSELKKIINDVDKELIKDTKYQEMLNVFNHNKVKDRDPKIILKTLNNQYVLTISDIIRCESEGAYTKFFVQGKNYLTSKNLKYYDEILTEHQFIRTHQSHLINSKHILRINNNGFIEMKNGTLVPISARKKAAVNKQLKSII